MAPLSVNGDRLIRSIQTLAKIGSLPNGGVCRPAYSPDDLKAREQVKDWFREAGMTVRMDVAGNLIGRYPGQWEQAPALATGSHIDTVPNGGQYDGAYGVLAGIEVVRVLYEQGIQLRHPVEVMVFTDEEGSMVGSKAMSGSLIQDPIQWAALEDRNIQDCLAQIGGNWTQLAQADRRKHPLLAFVELHVEQGPVLEAAQRQIGVVEGIVGQRRYQITIQGRSSHAGTTPMTMRQDALVAAAQVVLAVNRLAHLPGQQVATVGQMNLKPNAVNVIPGWVDMSLDIRDLSKPRIDQLVEQLQTELAMIATQTQTTIQLLPCLDNDPAIAQPHIQHIIVQTCEELGLSYLHLPSRASHDAQELAQLTDMGMIFVPSQSGISHAETEYTLPEHCIQGANVLLHTLLKLDRHYAKTTA
ncbi:MAG: Zn-dependent hydrolase [Thermosynechococcaceae cyanobacterium]